MIQNTQKAIDELNETRRGSLKINRIGILVRDDGSRVLLPPNVLADSAAYFNDRPIKATHDGENIGVVKNSQFDGTYTRAEYVLFNGYDGADREISAGYRALYSDTPGVWIDYNGVMGEVGKEYEYDRIATKILPEHIAVVENGRAGSTVTIELDTASNLILKENILNNKDTTMARKAKEQPEVIETLKEDAIEETVVEDKKEEAEEAKVEEEATIVETPDKPEEAKKEDVSVTPDRELSTEERESLSAADLLAYIKKVELKLDSLIKPEEPAIEEDAKKEPMWSKDEVKKRMKKVLSAAQFGIAMDADMMVADCATLDKYILDSLGFAQDSVDLDVNTVLTMKLEADAKLKVIKSEAKTANKNSKIEVSDDGGRITIKR
jgi:hypothetical protein